MIDGKFKITYENGLHARPATRLVSKANSFQSEMIMEYQEKKVNMKSIMGVMSLGVPANKTITIIFNGSDEDEAFKAITRVINEINDMK